MNSQTRSGRLLGWILACGLMVMVPAVSARVPTSGRNLAMGKTCRFDPAPSYDLCTDPDDARQLTDGVYNGCSWTDPGTVGWGTVKTPSVVIDVDLGEAAPIGQVTFDTIAGSADVTFPSAVLVFVSSDGEQYRYLCDVLTETIPQTAARNHRFSAKELKGWGRYVRLVMLTGGFFTFCDEIEVMRGDHTEQEASYPNVERVASAEVRRCAERMRDWANQKNGSLALLREAELALTAREKMLEDVDLPAEARRRIEAGRQQAMTDLSAAAIDYRGGPPYRDAERGAFAALGRINAKLWPGQDLLVWHKSDWARLGPLEGPSPRVGRAPQTGVHVDMMNNEWAVASFILTSTSAEAQTLTLTACDFEGPTTIPAGELLDIAHVVHLQAYGYSYPDDAIVPMDAGPVVLQPGVSKRIWLTFNTRGQNYEPGTRHATVDIDSNGKRVASVPVELRIWPLRFPDHTTLHSVSWGYFDDPPLVGREEAAARDLAAHYNTTLVLNHRYLPKPTPDQNGNLADPLDFTRLDQMIEWNPQCRMWLLWTGFRFGFGKMGTGEFGTPKWERAFTQYVTQVRDHLADRGIGKDQFAWYWTDEPSATHWSEDILASKTLKKIDPDMLVWANPGKEVPVAQLEEGLSYVDIYCPSTGTLGGVPGVLNVVGRTTRPSWMYASGGSRNADPFAYYRWFAWKAWRYKLGGIGMWVYSDESAATFSDYVTGPSFALIHGGGGQAIIRSKRWEAWRQGIADYEYLRMLRDSADAVQQAGARTGALAQARRILEEGVGRVLGEQPYNGSPEGADLPDHYRVQMLQCLAALQAQTRRAAPAR